MAKKRSRRTRWQLREGVAGQVGKPPEAVTKADLAQLRGLGLSDSDVTDAELPQVAGLTALEQLELCRTQVTDAGVPELQLALLGCEIIH